MFAMIISFVVWSMMSPIAPQMAKVYHLSALQKSILVATPILLGSVLRIPIGMLTDRFGGRRVYTLLLLYLIVPLVGISHAHSFPSLVIWEVFLGVAGASFAVAIGHVSGWYSSDRQGLVLGVTALGNIGTAVAGFTIPSMYLHFGFSHTASLLLIPVVLAAALIWLFTRDASQTRTAPAVPPTAHTVSVPQGTVKFWSKPILWILAGYYFLTFGGFVAFGNYLPTLLQGQFNLTPVGAGLRASGFVILATALRPIGGYLADRIRPLRLLVVVFSILALFSVVFAFSLTSMVGTTVAALVIAGALGIGNGSVFKLVPQYFPHQVGKAAGIIGAIGGIGGFFPPLVMGAIKDATGTYLGGLLLLAACSAAAVLLVFSEMRTAKKPPSRLLRA
ncbi:MAG: MFS transporter [Sulfobacillus sp.]